MRLTEPKSLHGAETRDSVGNVALGGGYLYIYSGNTLLHIASIPSPNLLGGSNRDTEVENHDEFTDEKGNTYIISIFSSAAGIYWELEKYPQEQKVLKQLRYEVKLNEY